MTKVLIFYTGRLGLGKGSSRVTAFRRRQSLKFFTQPKHYTIMSTALNEVIERHRTVITSTQLFGQEQPYAAEYAAQLRELGATICREQGISVSKGFDLPLETVLKEESLALYGKLNTWITQQPPFN